MGQREEITRHARGFTLLEVIITLFVIALAVGITVPTIARSTDSIKARAEVARFSAILRHTRERAITGRKAHAVVIDPQGHRMTVHTGGPEGEVKETRTLPLTGRALVDSWLIISHDVVLRIRLSLGASFLSCATGSISHSPGLTSRCPTPLSAAQRIIPLAYLQ